MSTNPGNGQLPVKSESAYNFVIKVNHGVIISPFKCR